MYYSELPDCIKYKIVKGPKNILERIVENHNSKWNTQIDYIIYNQDLHYCLLIEKTQEEIVEEIKERIRENIGNLNLSLQDRSYILNGLELCDYVIDFDKYKEYFTLEDIYPECFPKPKKYKPVIIKGEKISLPDIDELKRINILLVLDKLGIEYKKIGSNTYALYENGKRTDGRRANTTQNIVTDFSAKGRPYGNPFHFVSLFLDLDTKETALRFKENIC